LRIHSVGIREQARRVALCREERGVASVQGEGDRQPDEPGQTGSPDIPREAPGSGNDKGNLPMVRSKRMFTVMSIAAGCLSGIFSAVGAGKSLLPVVEIEGPVYTPKPANNGAGPLWGNASTCIVRLGDKLFASGLETIEDAAPLNNVRWLLFELRDHGWELIRADPEDRTREPCPLAIFPDGRLFLSVNPTLTPPGTRNGPAEPRVLEFSTENPRGPYRTLLPVWDGAPSFTEHSYRSFAADGPNQEFILFQNVGYDHAEWAFYDRTDIWSARGKLIFPWGAEYEKPKPVRVCYPAVALKNRSVYWLGVSDVTEPNNAWRAYKKKLTGRDWDYDFRRLFYTWCPDITTGRFHDWIEVANREKTCGWLFPCDLWVAPDGAVHLLWRERAIDERLRKEFFPDAKQSWALNHAIVRNGKVIRRSPLAIGGEGLSDEIPGNARFQVTPDNRLFVFYYCSGTDAGGRPFSENRVMEVFSDGTHGKPVRVPLEHPFSSFINATVRSGSGPSEILDILGVASGRPGISYARIRLLNEVFAAMDIKKERTADGVRLHLDGAQSRAALGRIASWVWEVGGTRLEGKKAQCELRKSEPVNIALTVRDRQGRRNTVRQVLRLPPVPKQFGRDRWGLVLRTEAEDFSGQSGGNVRIATGLRGASALAVSDWKKQGHRLEWILDVPVEDDYFPVLHYAAPQASTRELTVDGGPPHSLVFTATDAFSTSSVDAWGYALLFDARKRVASVHLTKGVHTIGLDVPSASDLALDYIDWVARASNADVPRADTRVVEEGAYRILLPLKGTICPARIRPEKGHCFIAILGPNYPGDGWKGRPESTLQLFENGNPLGPPHAVHNDIRSKGRGRFSHWKTRLYFSTSDNTDPRTNGRSYAWRILPRDARP